jgi:hypothetical protein
MALTQCPKCFTPVVGEPRCMAVCGCCGADVRIPTGFQAPVYHRPVYKSIEGRRPNA